MKLSIFQNICLLELRLLHLKSKYLIFMRTLQRCLILCFDTSFPFQPNNHQSLFLWISPRHIWKRKRVWKWWNQTHEIALLLKPWNRKNATHRDVIGLDGLNRRGKNRHNVVGASLSRQPRDYISMAPDRFRGTRCVRKCGLIAGCP